MYVRAEAALAAWAHPMLTGQHAADAEPSAANTAQLRGRAISERVKKKMMVPKADTKGAARARTAGKRGWALEGRESCAGRFT